VDPRLGKLDGCLENFLIRPSVSLAEYIRGAVEAKGTVISAPSGKIDEPIEENLVAKISVSQSPSNLVNSFLFPLVLRREKMKNLSPCERFFMQGFLKDRIKRREMGWFCVQRMIFLFAVQVDLGLLDLG
jgi:hypothetical protein